MLLTDCNEKKSEICGPIYSMKIFNSISNNQALLDLIY